MGKKSKVLVVDDEKIACTALGAILKEHYEVLEAADGKEAFELLSGASEEIAAVILDIVMPEYDGYYFLERYRASDMYQEVPVIMATVEDDAAVEKRCLELGAWDFIGKPYDPDIIRFRIRNVIEHSQLQISRELKYRAEFDVLTGIYNKSNMFQATSEIVRRYADKNFAFIRMDIEKFQLINSFFGMDEGDRLLKYIAHLLTKEAGGRDDIVYGRIEADIFGICMPYSEQQELLDFTGRLRERLGSYPLEFDIVPIFGIYLIEERSVSPNHMYDRANLAAKHCKGNYIRNYAFYTRRMSEEIEKEQRIVNSMKHALEDEQFILYLQPKYELSDNQVAGAEVLVRWQSRERGMVSPGEFIPVFERNGFITKLDCYVWEKTCMMLRKWLDEGKNPRPVSVNLSRVSLYNPKLVETICGLVEKYDIPRYLFQLELTESAYTSNPKVVQETMQRLQNEGFSILMDDFGSGYSSLNVLKDIDVDVLKMDMRFLSDTDKRRRGENILMSVVRMAKWLNMPVVAEGVERREQADFLRSIGCEYVQGFYFAKPMPVEDYEKLVFTGTPEASGGGRVSKTDSPWPLNSRIEELFLKLQQGVAVYEYSGNQIKIVLINDAYYNVCGGDMINEGKRRLFIIDRRYESRMLDAFRQAVDTKQTVDCEFLWDDEAAGRVDWFHLELHYMKQDGEKHVLYGILTNITEQKELDRELQKYRMALS